MLWLTTLAGEFSRFSYLAYLALRIPSPIDERRACLLRWLSIFLGLLDVLVGILIVFRFQPFSINFPWTASLTPAFVVGGAYALLKVAIAVLHLMLLRRLGIAFRGSANLRELPASSL